MTIFPSESFLQFDEICSKKAAIIHFFIFKYFSHHCMEFEKRCIKIIFGIVAFLFFINFLKMW